MIVVVNAVNELKGTHRLCVFVPSIMVCISKHALALANDGLLMNAPNSIVLFPQSICVKVLTNVNAKLCET